MTLLQEIDKLLHDYRAWLKDKTTLREANDSWIEDAQRLTSTGITMRCRSMRGKRMGGTF